MPFKKGQSGNPKGRKPGKPNRDTADFKAALTRLLNAADVEQLLEDVPPERRLDVLGRLAEYVFPKLGRSEVVGEGGGPLRAVFRIQEDSPLRSGERSPDSNDPTPSSDAS